MGGGKNEGMERREVRQAKLSNYEIMIEFVLITCPTSVRYVLIFFEWQAPLDSYHQFLGWSKDCFSSLLLL